MALATSAFDPTATYSDRNLVKHGAWAKVVQGTGGARAAWVAYPYGHSYITSFNTINLQANSSDVLSVTASPGVNDAISIKYARTTASKNTPDLILAALIAATGVQMILTVNQAWVDAPPLFATSIGSSTVSITYTDRVYQCRAAVIGSADYVGVMPANSGKWNVIHPYSPESAGIRSGCHAENSYESYICGRCGSPLA